MSSDLKQVRPFCTCSWGSSARLVWVDSDPTKADHVEFGFHPQQLDDAKPQQLDDAKPQQLDDAKPQQLDDAKPQQLDDAKPQQLDSSVNSDDDQFMKKDKFLSH
ncbi:hypothetical protein LSAT2_006169 [Lamellibrachia satsuma]|nr:hypothetical protein LSAT2_006169 [Lamellibrachia satsuma]